MSVVAVVGLGYVGLPLAVEFGKKRKTIGFDLSQREGRELSPVHRSDRRGVERRTCAPPSSSR